MKDFKLLLCVLLFPVAAMAQGDAVRLLVAAPAGGGTDVVSRILIKEAAPLLNEAMLVQNIPAAGGVIAMSQMMQAPPNGKTLVAMANGSLTAIPHLIKVPFTADDYIPLLGVSSAPYVVCASPAFPATNAKEFVEVLKANPDKYTIGTDGGAGWLSTQRALRALGASVRNISYKGAAEIVVGFLGGHIDLYSGGTASILQSSQTGKANCYLLTTADRSPSFPQAAGLNDFGIGSEETPLWRIVLAPKNTPPDIVARLEAAFLKAANSTAMRQFHTDNGEKFIVFQGEELRARLKREYDGLGKVAQSLGLKP